MQLKNVSGFVENLNVVRTKQNILYGPQMEEAAGISAMVFALAGMGGAAVQTAANIDGGADEVDMYSFDLNGQRFAGCTRSASFRNGDAVELVYEERSQGLEVLGVRRVETRSIWLYPYMSRGSRAGTLATAKLLGWAIGVGAFGILFIAYLVWEGRLPSDVIFSVIVISILVVVGAVSWMLPRLYRFSKAADQVFAAFGYESPSWVDLQKTTKAYRKVNRIPWSAKNVAELWY